MGFRHDVETIGDVERLLAIMYCRGRSWTGTRNKDKNDDTGFHATTQKGSIGAIGKVKLHPKGDWKASRGRQRKYETQWRITSAAISSHGDPISAGVPIVLGVNRW